MLYAIVAHDDNLGIGVSGHLPWHLSEDLQHFRNVTSQAVVIMGMSTWKSLPEKSKPLPGRLNIVITRSQPEPHSGVVFCSSIESALIIACEECKKRSCDAYVIGGAQIYSQMMSMVDGIYVTIVHATMTSDCHISDYAHHFPNSEVLAKGVGSCGLGYTMIFMHR